MLEVCKTISYFEIQSAFMTEHQQTLDTLKDIRDIMNRSSRFMSLSGWSGVAAGCCALVGAWRAHGVIQQGMIGRDSLRKLYDAPAEIPEPIQISDYVGSSELLQIAFFTLVAALLSAILFTWWRNRKAPAPIWNATSRRLIVALGVPMLVGGIYMIKLMEIGAFGFIAPGCLLFYGIGLISASRFTLGEIRWLGYAQLVIGIANLFYIGYGLYFWAFGFGVLHIIYGLIMWWKHERQVA